MAAALQELLVSPADEGRQNVSLPSDLQLVFNPALNPAEDRVWVLGLRASLAL
jgi:hypothetical protein